MKTRETPKRLLTDNTERYTRKMDMCGDNVYRWKIDAIFH